MAKSKPVRVTYQPPTKWDIDTIHTLEIEFDGDVVPVRVHEISYREHLIAREHGEEAVVTLINAAVVNPEVIPMRYAPLVGESLRDFFTAPAKRVALAGVTESDAPEPETGQPG